MAFLYTENPRVWWLYKTMTQMCFFLGWGPYYITVRSDNTAILAGNVSQYTLDDKVLPTLCGGETPLNMCLRPSRLPCLVWDWNMALIVPDWCGFITLWSKVDDLVSVSQFWGLSYDYVTSHGWAIWSRWSKSGRKTNFPCWLVGSSNKPLKIWITNKLKYERVSLNW